MLRDAGCIKYMVLVTRPSIEKEDGSRHFLTYPNEEIPVEPQTAIALTRDSDGSSLILGAFDHNDVFTLVKVGAISIYFNRAEKAMHGINSMVSNDAFPQKNTVHIIMCRIREYLDARAQSTDEYIRSQHDNMRNEVSCSREAVLKGIYRLRNKLIAHYDKCTPGLETALEDNTNSTLIAMGEFMGVASRGDDDFGNVLGSSHFFYQFFSSLYYNICALEDYIERQGIGGI